MNDKVNGKFNDSFEKFYIVKICNKECKNCKMRLTGFLPPQATGSENDKSFNTSYYFKH